MRWANAAVSADDVFVLRVVNLGRGGRLVLHLMRPQRLRVGAGVIVGVEGVNPILHRGDGDHVMHAPAGDARERHVKWLRVNLPLDSVRKQLAELVQVDVARIQDCFLQIGPLRALSLC